MAAKAIREFLGLSVKSGTVIQLDWLKSNPPSSAGYLNMVERTNKYAQQVTASELTKVILDHPGYASKLKAALWLGVFGCHRLDQSTAKLEHARCRNM
jgi:hypothetical protein